MINIAEIKEIIFFENDGEIDLLTGAMAPNRFNQLIKRDIEISERNGNLLSMISLKLDLTNFLSLDNLRKSKEECKFDVEAYLIEMNFKLNNILRSSDCIARVSKTGFWIFINSITADGFINLENRIRNTFPSFVNLNVIYREFGQDQTIWYRNIDAKHFNDN